MKNCTSHILALVLVQVLFINVSFAQNWDWVSSFGGSKSDKALDMDIDAYGNVYVCGYYNSTPLNDVTFGTISVPPNGFGKEGFIAKVDPNGNFVWGKIAPGGWDERILGIHVDKVNDFVYACGTAWSYTSFGSCNNGNFPGGMDEIFIGKFDLNGNCQWLRGAGGDSDDHGYDMVTDSTGNIYLTGYISDKYGWGGVVAHFGSINIPVGVGDSLGFIAKITPAGTISWVKSFHGVQGERDNRIAIDKDDNVYVTGGIDGVNVSMGNTNVTSNGGYDIYVIKFDSQGNQQWVKTAGSPLDDRGNSIYVDVNNEIYITGEFRDHVIFGQDTLNNNGGPSGRDIFVAKMDVNGNWKWAKKAGSGKSSERGNRIVANATGNIFVTGQIRGNANFGSNISLDAGPDSIQVFVAAIDTAGKWKWAIQAGSDVIDRGTGLAVDDSCNLYVCGYYENTAAFDSTYVTAKGRKDGFVSRIPEACFINPVNPIDVPDTCVVIIPNVFTPNGDNINDYFSLPDSCIQSLNITLYNRWGESMANLTQPDHFWDGKHNGNPASEGVYYYTGSVFLNDSKLLSVKGFVTLMR
jgi:gliding motility-associated-like protein